MDELTREIEARRTQQDDARTGNYVKIVQRVPVKIVFDDPRVKDYPLAPGMSVVPSVRVR